MILLVLIFDLGSPLQKRVSGAPASSTGTQNYDDVSGKGLRFPRLPRTVFSALSGMRLLACLIVAPPTGLR
jgi:hypothetical protein